jgi:hypothetical protein
MFRKRKLKPKDIFVIWDAVNKLPHYRALLCVRFKGHSYEKKDLQRVAIIKLIIERETLPWWEIKESESKNAFWLYYHPDINIQEAQKRNREMAESKGLTDSVIFKGPDTREDSLKDIAISFNSMLNELN